MQDVTTTDMTFDDGRTNGIICLIAKAHLTVAVYPAYWRDTHKNTFITQKNNRFLA